MFKHFIAILFVCILSIRALTPIAKNGFFPMHDDTQVGRVVVMGKALQQGQFPVRWVSDLGYGYGYPIFNFYGPLPYYVGGIFYAIGFKGLIATKLMFIMGVLLAAVSMYLLGSYTFGIPGGIVASIFYTYAPYHAVQIYVRGAVGEYWAYALLPVIILGVTLIAKGQKKKGVLIGGLGMASVVISHTLLGYATVFLYLSSLVTVFSISKITKYFRISVYPYLVLLGIGILLSTFFWLPAFFEMKYTAVSGLVGPGSWYADHFVCLDQLWNSPWGFGGSAPGCIDGISFKLGKLYIIGAVSALLIWLFRRKKNKGKTGVFLIGLVITAVSLYLVLPYSLWLWRILPGFMYIQYPWRFLTYTLCGLSILIGYLISEVKGKLLRWIIVLVSVGLCYFVNAKLFVPQYFYAKNAGDFESVEELRFRVSKISDEYLPTAVPRPKSVSEIATTIALSEKPMQLETEIISDTYNKIFVSTDVNQRIILQRAYFPGWNYYVDGEEVQPVIIDGLPHVQITQGRHSIESRFTNTPIREITNLVSMLTLGIIMLTYGKKTYT